MKNGTIFLVAAAIATLLSGCAAEEYMRDGVIRVDIGDRKTHDFKTIVRTAYDIGLNTNVKADRVRLSKRLLAKQCPTARLVNETKIQTHTLLTGPAYSYIMLWKCQ